MVGSQQNNDTYFSRLHLVGIATLALLTLALALFGWSLRPSSGGYPVLNATAIAVLSPTDPGGNDPRVTEALTRTSDGGKLILKSDFVNGVLPTSSRWSVDFYNLDPGYRLCTPKGIVFTGGGVLQIPLSPQRLSHPNLPSTNPEYAYPVQVSGRGVMWIELCWPSGGPVQANGAYLSAQFLPVQPGTAQGVRLIRQLNVGVGTTTDYSIQSVVLPDDDYLVGWQWSTRPPAGSNLAVSAVDTTETQHDNYEAFLSGIVFGVAGGALVALIQELVAPFRTRKELRPPEPGG